MATIKSYSDLQQSKKLSEILPLESADMNYTLEDFVDEDTGDIFSIEKVSLGQPSDTEIGCWSLAALLGVLPNMISRYFKILGWCYGEWNCAYMDEDGEIKYNSIADNPVDACVAMIERLHELKML